MKSPARSPIRAAAAGVTGVLATASLLFARAGGGGGYGGGGGLGGGGGGFAGGGGFSGTDSAEGEFSWLSLVVVVAIVLLSVLLKAVQERRREHSRRRRRRKLGACRHEQVLRQLQERDVQFDPDRFLRRLSQAFLDIQHAWSAQELSSLRAFVSDGIFERFSLQIQEQRALGYHDQIQEIRLHHLAFAQCRVEEPFDVVTVRIEASAIDYRRSLTTHSIESGETSRKCFVEFWTLMRRRGAQTRASDGLLEGACPNCGAPVSINQSAKCQNCDGVLRSGQYDWVLCEITQDCEWRSGATQEVLGLAEFRSQRDPLFSLQQLEDRASVIFWRKALADHQGSIAPLRKVAGDSFAEDYQRQLAADSDGARFYYGDCAVGAVDVRGLLPADEEEPFDRAFVEVRWSGKRFHRYGDGGLFRTDTSGLFRSVLVLARQPESLTDVNTSLSSAHCPACGAPETAVASHTCEFCHEVLNDGSRGWVLMEILPEGSAEALVQAMSSEREALGGYGKPAAPPQVAIAPQSPGVELQGATATLAWLIKVALADSVIERKERRALLRIAKQHNISQERLDIIIEAVRSAQVDLPEPEKLEQAQQWLSAAIDQSLTDGEVCRQELVLMTDVAAKFGLAEADVKRMIKKRAADLSQREREASGDQRLAVSG